MQCECIRELAYPCMQLDKAMAVGEVHLRARIGEAEFSLMAWLSIPHKTLSGDQIVTQPILAEDETRLDAAAYGYKNHI
jgi:hypothetical protein